MKFHIHPDHFRHFTQDLTQKPNDAPTHLALLKHYHALSKTAPNHPAYDWFIKAFNLPPLITIRFDERPSRNINNDTRYALLEAARRRLHLQNTKTSQTRIQKQNPKQTLTQILRTLLTQFRNNAAHQPFALRSLDNCPQNIIYAVAHQSYSHLTPNVLAEHTDNPAPLLQQFVRSITHHIGNVPFKVMKATRATKSIWLDTVTGSAHLHNTPKITVDIYHDVTSDEREHRHFVAQTTYDSMVSRTRRKETRWIPFSHDQNATQTTSYTLATAPSIHSGNYEPNAHNIWVPVPAHLRWLCTHKAPNPDVLNYTHQPANIWPLTTDKPHRLGLEIEFIQPYDKSTALRETQPDGTTRPLTPRAVLERHGWAICFDRSVQPGGELKSPILPFSNANELPDMIPTPIQQFIQQIAKDEKCGGHINYSSAKYEPSVIFNVMESWAFIFALLYPKRLTNRFCQFIPIQDRREHYQWMRLKDHCVEMRIFPNFWDVANVLWRAQLIQALVQTATLKHMQPLLRTTIRPASMTNIVLTNWNHFSKDKLNSVRQHINVAMTTTELNSRLTRSNIEYISTATRVPPEQFTPIADSAFEI